MRRLATAFAPENWLAMSSNGGDKEEAVGSVLTLCC